MVSGLVFRGLQRQRDGVLHPETHAQMFGPNDFHNSPAAAAQAGDRRQVCGEGRLAGATGEHDVRQSDEAGCDPMIAISIAFAY